MAAVQFADGAYCFGGNALSAAAMPWPTAIATLAILGCGIAFAVGDARELAAAREGERAANVRLEQMAFVDRDSRRPSSRRRQRALSD